MRDYGPLVLEHYDHPRNVGEAPGENAVATVTSEGCGDRLRLSLRVEGGRVRAARFRTLGCVAAIAASSMTTELLCGRTLAEARTITDRQVAEALGGLPPGKEHCSVLAERAIAEALNAYESRAATERSAAPGAQP